MAFLAALAAVERFIAGSLDGVANIRYPENVIEYFDFLFGGKREEALVPGRASYISEPM